MKIETILRDTGPANMLIRTKHRSWLAKISLFTVCIAMLLLSACNDSSVASTPTPVHVNGFGTAGNHAHSLQALPNGVLVIATHYGIFHSADHGKNWQQVAAGSNQLMQDLMTTSLTTSSLNPRRLYVVTFPAVTPHQGTLGLYSSADQGVTWKMTVSEQELGRMFLVAAGNDTPDEVFLYLSSLGTLGLKVSLDDGQHFSATGTLPFGRLAGLLALPGKPGQLLAYSSDGAARSTDGGLHWQVITSINGAIQYMTSGGPDSPIYASGDSGIYASQDGGQTFTLVYTQSSYTALTAAPSQPQVLYGTTGAGVFRSSDGGHTWKQLPVLKKSYNNIAIDPTNANLVYVAVNYPTEVYSYKQGDASWSSLTPKP